MLMVVAGEVFFLFFGFYGKLLKYYAFMRLIPIHHTFSYSFIGIYHTFEKYGISDI